MTRYSLLLAALLVGMGFVPSTTERPSLFVSSSLAEEATETGQPVELNQEEEDQQPSSPAAAEDAEMQQDEEDEAEGE